MNKDLKASIKQILSDNAAEAYSCLYPPESYAWGGNRKEVKNTVTLMNKILSQIPKEAWPENIDDSNQVKCGRWSLSFNYVDNKMAADLRWSGDDHSAWVVKRGKKFVDFDIGGS